MVSIRRHVLDKGIMQYSSCLWEYIHPLVGVHTPTWLPVRRCAHFEPCTWDCIYLWIILGSWIYFSFCILIHPCNYLGKYFPSMHMYLDLMSEMALFTCSFIVVNSDVVVMNYPGYSMIFPPTLSLFLWVYVFCVLITHTALTTFDLLSFGLSLWRMN